MTLDQAIAHAAYGEISERLAAAVEANDAAGGALYWELLERIKLRAVTLLPLENPGPVIR